MPYLSLSCRVVFCRQAPGCNQGRRGRKHGQLRSTQVPRRNTEKAGTKEGMANANPGGFWKSRQLPAPVGMALFPRLLTCSDNCILRVLGRARPLAALAGPCWSCKLARASAPGRMHVCACTAVRAFGPSGATRRVMSKSRDAGELLLCWLLPRGVTRSLPPVGDMVVPQSPLAVVCNCTSAPLPPPSRCRHSQKNTQTRRDCRGARFEERGREQEKGENGSAVLQQPDQTRAGPHETEAWERRRQFPTS